MRSVASGRLHTRASLSEIHPVGPGCPVAGAMAEFHHRCMVNLKHQQQMAEVDRLRARREALARQARALNDRFSTRLMPASALARLGAMLDRMCDIDARQRMAQAGQRGHAAHRESVEA